MSAEVSSAGLRNPCNEVYPAPRLLDMLRAQEIPVTSSSDSHRLDNVAFRFGEIRELIVATGYTSVRAYSQRRPRDYPLLVD
jgi:histidinol-phosphatase (PHP family)